MGFWDKLKSAGVDRGVLHYHRTDEKAGLDENPYTQLAIPGAPVSLPPGREMTPEEVAHEGSHQRGGLSQAMVGTLGGMLTGTKDQRLLPDEVLAYLNQPDSPASQQDWKDIEAAAALQGGLWGRLVGRAMRNRRGRGR